MLVGALIVGIASLFITGCSGSMSKTVTYQEKETQGVLLEKAKRGNAEAMYKYALRSNAMESDGLKWMKKSAEKGYARAQFWLGVAYTEGNLADSDQDPEESKKWFMKSFKQGFPMAKVWCYYYGVGNIEPDKDKSWNELIKSARAGWVDSQFFLSLVYMEVGPLKFRDVDKDEEKALYWMETAANNGYELAQLAVAQKYYSESKDEVAIKWLKKAAIQGNPEAQLRLAEAYYKGRGVEKDLEEAKKWAQNAADQGLPIAKDFIKEIKNTKNDSVADIDELFD